MGVVVKLERAPTAQVRSLLVDAYRGKAPKKLGRQLDAEVAVRKGGPW